MKDYTMPRCLYLLLFAATITALLPSTARASRCAEEINQAELDRIDKQVTTNEREAREAHEAQRMGQSTLPEPEIISRYTVIRSLASTVAVNLECIAFPLNTKNQQTLARIFFLAGIATYESPIRDRDKQVIDAFRVSLRIKADQTWPTTYPGSLRTLFNTAYTQEYVLDPVSASARVKLSPAEAVSINGRSLSSDKASLPQRSNLVQGRIGARWCTWTLEVTSPPTTTSTLYLSLEGSAEHRCGYKLRKVYRDPDVPTIAAGAATALSGIATAVSLAELDRTYDALLLHEGESCCTSPEVGTLCSDLRRGQVRTWSLIALTAGLGVTTGVLAWHHTQGGVEVTLAPTGSGVQLSLRFP